MFPEGRQLRQLHTLCIDYVKNRRPSIFDEETSFPRMITACPALRSLCLANIVSGGSMVAATMHMQCCHQPSSPCQALGSAAVYMQCLGDV